MDQKGIDYIFNGSHINTESGAWELGIPSGFMPPVNPGDVVQVGDWRGVAEFKGLVNISTREFIYPSSEEFKAKLVVIESPEFQQKIEKNIWHDASEFDEVVKTIKRLSGNEVLEESRWSWARNSACKYIDIRIDMRDGGFLLSGRDGRINLEQLLWQYKSLEKKS